MITSPNFSLAPREKTTNDPGGFFAVSSGIGSGYEKLQRSAMFIESPPTRIIQAPERHDLARLALIRHSLVRDRRLPCRSYGAWINQRRHSIINMALRSSSESPSVDNSIS